MDPVEALDRIATLLERERAATYKVQAFRRAADTVRDDARRRAAEASPQRGGSRTCRASAAAPRGVIAEALAGEAPEVPRPASRPTPSPTPGRARRSAGAARATSTSTPTGPTAARPIEAMARHAIELGHEYLALTDHSPRLKIAKGLTPERLRKQLDVVAELNEELAPFRILTGIEVDILEDGTLDQEDGAARRARRRRRQRALEAAHAGSNR